MRIEITERNFHIFFICALLLSIGLVSIVLGAEFNNIAISSNGGKMPIMTTQSIYYSNPLFNSNKYFLFYNSSNVQVAAFSDRFYIKNKIYSLGDFVVLFGFLTFIISFIFVAIYIYLIFRRGKKDEQ